MISQRGNVITGMGFVGSKSDRTEEEDENVPGS
jgi:hypothetical protein